MNINYSGGENFNLRDILMAGHNLNLEERANLFDGFMNHLEENHESLYMRQIDSPADREVLIVDPSTGETKKMLMFGSNNYLGLANHPYVKKKVKEAIDQFGVGIGGPPLLNGHTSLHRQLEERLAQFKRSEDAIIFSSGYNANVGLLSAILTKNDIMIYDAYSHASFVDGLRLSKTQALAFCHNDVVHLEKLLKQNAQCVGDVYVGVEGVYSMDGDLSPLDEIVPLCKKYSAKIILDDAHGTGVMGNNGRGTAEHFEVEGQIDITMGTFSKAFGVVGGFVAGSHKLINYLRFFSRSHMFSASLTPMNIAAVLAGLDIIENDTELLQNLWSNINYASMKLNEIGFDKNLESAIIALRVPEGMNIRRTAHRFHRAGIFVNSIEYPAVPVNQQRFRISLMSSHTREDIDTLMKCVGKIWKEWRKNNMQLNETQFEENKNG